MLTAIAVFLSAWFAPAHGQDAPPPTDLRGVLLDLAEAHDPSVNRRRLRAKLDVFALELRRKLEGLEGAARPEAFAEYFFTDCLFSSDPDLSSPSNFYLDRILDGRSGYCLTLSALMICVGRKLGLPVFGVAVPRHFFVRWDDGVVRYDIETTEGGRRRDDDFYRRRGVSAAAEKEGIYLTNLGDDRVAAFLYNNEGYIHWCAGRTEQAERGFRKALEVFGDLPEAWLNLGVVAGERGDVEVAEKAFARAAAWIGKDRTLQLNRAVAAMRDGRVREGLVHAEKATVGKDGAIDVAAYRHFVGATLLREDRWKQYQADVIAAGKKLKSSGRLRPGLMASYYRDREFTDRAVLRVERELEHKWRWSPPVRGVAPESFSVRWDGYVEIQDAGAHEFFLVFEQAVRLRVDGVLFVDHSRGKREKLARETIVLDAGLHELRIEYVALGKPNGIIFQVKRADETRAFARSRFSHLP